MIQLAHGSKNIRSRVSRSVNHRHRVSGSNDRNRVQLHAMLNENENSSPLTGSLRELFLLGSKSFHDQRANTRLTLESRELIPIWRANARAQMSKLIWSGASQLSGLTSRPKAAVRDLAPDCRFGLGPRRSADCSVSLELQLRSRSIDLGAKWEASQMKITRTFPRKQPDLNLRCLHPTIFGADGIDAALTCCCCFPIGCIRHFVCLVLVACRELRSIVNLPIALSVSSSNRINQLLEIASISRAHVYYAIKPIEPRIRGNTNCID